MRRSWRYRYRRVRQCAAISNYGALQRGDFVVHGNHGIGRYTGIRRLHAGEDFHERAFACAIFANHREHFAAIQREVHAAQGQYAGILFGDLPNLQQGRYAVLAHGRYCTLPRSTWSGLS